MICDGMFQRRPAARAGAATQPQLWGLPCRRRQRRRRRRRPPLLAPCGHLLRTHMRVGRRKALRRLPRRLPGRLPPQIHRTVNSRARRRCVRRGVAGGRPLHAAAAFDGAAALSFLAPARWRARRLRRRPRAVLARGSGAGRPPPAAAAQRTSHSPLGRSRGRGPLFRVHGPPPPAPHCLVTSISTLAPPHASGVRQLGAPRRRSRGPLSTRTHACMHTRARSPTVLLPSVPPPK